MRSTILALVGIAVNIPSVLAHYNFESLIVAGQATSPYQYIRRTTNSNSPQQNVASLDMRCNTGGNDAAIRAATQTYTVAAGTRVGFKINEYLGHPGPIQVYLSKAPTGTTAQNYLGDGNWFKIYQLTTETESSQGITWASFVGGGIRNFTFTLPSSLPAGEYLMRGEHIATHGAGQFGGSQFYMGCAQLKVTGSGSGTPGPLVKFPGAYTGREPGILYNPYWPTVTNYTAPGPAVWPVPCEDHTANLNGQAYDGDCTPLRR